MKRFVFWMLLASGLGFIKLMALAYAMVPNDYGQYLAYFGIATLSGALMSAGSVEKTIKGYPRQWVTGVRRVMLANAFTIAHTLALRFLLAAAVGIVAAISGWASIRPVDVIWIVGLGMCTAWLALLASLYRAAGSQKALQDFNLYRGLGALCFGLPAGWLLGWQGAIAGDVAACLLSIGISIWHLPRLYRDDPAVVAQTLSSTLEVRVDRGHQQLYLANLAVMSTTMIDKAWLSASLGAAQTGAYGVVMLIPQIAQLLVGVIVQHIGPLIIKFVHIEHRDTGRLSNVGLQAGLLALFSTVLTLTALAAKRLPYLDHIFIKFAISDLSIILAGILASSQIYSIVEFHLIARDRERDVLLASVVAGILFFSLFAIATLLNAKVEWFIAAVGVSRWCQVAMLRRAYHG